MDDPFAIPGFKENYLKAKQQKQIQERLYEQLLSRGTASVTLTLSPDDWYQFALLLKLAVANPVAAVLQLDGYLKIAVERIATALEPELPELAEDLRREVRA